MAGDELGGGALSADNLDYLLAVEVAALSEEPLFAVVVVFGVEAEVPGYASVGPNRVALGAEGHVLGVAYRPAGEGAGGFLYIVLAVVADAHGEEFEQFPAEVFVDGAAMVVVVVEPDYHGGVFGEFEQEGLEVAHAVAPEHSYLVAEHLALGYLGISGGEYAVPEQGHLLAERVGGGNHLVEPVGARIVLSHHAGLLVVVSADHVVAHFGDGLGFEQALDGGFVSVVGERFEFAAVRSEARAPRQVSHKPQVGGVGCHLCASV